MVMTLQSFNTEDRILNQVQREDLFSNMSYMEAISRTHPIIIMDEPQEGMDTENSIKRVAALQPLMKIRYSATHKVLRNLIYRLSPYSSYKQGLVKKIEVLTVSEKNDEASMKLELERVELGRGEPKAVLKVWQQTAAGFKFKNTRKLKDGARLLEVSNNIIYRDYVIEKIAKPIRERGFVRFTNGVVLYEGEKSKNLSSIFSEQLYWLIDSHFRKKKELQKHGIKCLSLIFIDRVDNYIQPEGLVKKAFVEQYKKVHREFYGTEATGRQQVLNCQGYYFAKTGRGDYTDRELSMSRNRELFDLILRDRERLLTMENPVEFIFSHSALGVGWDNPNVFNIATLNQSYSEIKKRQEIGRGLRICVNQDGERVYDKAETPEGEEINLLTIVPNETYETFLSQYQSEITAIYGSDAAGAKTRNVHKGQRRSQRRSEKRISRNEEHFTSPSFREFWKRLSRKTEYLVDFNEQELINNSIAAINEITIPEHEIQITHGRIQDMSRKNLRQEIKGWQKKKATPTFPQIDLVEELSENTSLAYPTVFRIIQGITNKQEIARNPPVFLREAAKKIRNVELNEMLRALDYRLTGEAFDITRFEKFIVRNTDKLEPTPNKGVYDHIIRDSSIEQDFAKEAEADAEVVCFLKLPPFYVIKTPVGPYNPDFGLVLKKRTIRKGTEHEYYFVIETKGSNDLDDRRTLTKNELYKIKCAIKHFNALGIEAKVDYIAPIKTFETFRKRAEAQMEEAANV